MGEFFGVKLAIALPSFVGAAISLKFVEGQNWWQRMTTVLCGGAAAAYCTPLTVDLLMWAGVFSSFPSARTEGAIAFVGGLFGMALIGAAMKAIPEIIAAARKRFLGS